MAKKPKQILSVDAEDSGGKVTVELSSSGIPFYAWREQTTRERISQFTPLRIQVWPASEQKSSYFELTKFHFAGEPGWPREGVTTFDLNKKIYRYFELNQIKIHPNEFKRKKKPLELRVKPKKSYYKSKKKK